ncbi:MULTISPECIES: hypothetical protein [unclassified Paraburkholderia]|uniref:hypothetical protein n=1 Tax=unclassified Paraburkholderia TaxID=2615204 RepID=UPI002AB2B55C|nr:MULTISPECIES: hypothetical protein [unclassified Paraburkholderia]
MLKRQIATIALCAVIAFGLMHVWSAKGEATNVQQGKHVMQANLSFALGENSDEIMRKAAVPIRKSTVSTALMYDTSRIATGVEPVFQLRDVRHGVLFPQATDVEFMSDSEEGARVRNIEVTFKVPPPPHDIKDQAALGAYDDAMYRYVMDVIERVNRAGWKRFIAADSPRLAGLDTYVFDAPVSGQRYSPPPGIVYADPTYPLTREEWNRLRAGDTVVWSWHVDNMFIELKYTKDFRAADAPLVVGDQLSATVRTDEAWLDAFGKDGDVTPDALRARYRNALPEMLATRRKAEAMARAQGATILDHWNEAVISGIPVRQ